MTAKCYDYDISGSDVNDAAFVMFVVITPDHHVV